MKYFLLILKNIGISFLIFLVLNFITTILGYFNILSNSTISIFQILISIISLFVGGVLIGAKSDKKGFLEGIKFGVIICLIFLLLNMIFIKDFMFKNIFYYIILIVSSMIGGMIGITKKANS